MKYLKNTRTVMALLVFLVIVASTLIAAGLYALLTIFHLVPRDTVFSLWLPLIIAVTCNAIGGIGASIYYSHVTKPIRDMVDAMNKIADGNYDVHLSAGANLKELSELTDTLNRMAEQLSGTETMQMDFLNTISHEFKTPVSSILGYARLLQRENLSAAERKEYAGIIMEESRHLSEMTTNILLLTKYENTELVQNSSCYSLDEQVRQCVQQLAPVWLKKNIDMEGDFVPVNYVGNEELMTHIWKNLIQNAIQHTPEGGQIRCATRELKDEVEVIVQDNGEGMSPETQERIFERFYQADSSRGSGGNGLGLSIVKRLVDLNQGTIQVESVLGAGSTFTIRLPKKRNKPRKEVRDEN